MPVDIPNSLPALTRDLIALRQKPSTEERFKAYPAMLQRFSDLLAVCEDVAILREVISLDNGYYLLAGYRQQILEKWLTLERTSEVLRLYAMQLFLFGDVDHIGRANTDVEEHIAALEQEADALDKQQE
jgi:hypothetical protein